jgi:NADH:ubiquinone oxidoreductase subunit 5 (subunit L)/multisubunit Na+/H+ antiporter MnhA subunit
MTGLIAGVVGLPLLASGLVTTILHRLPARCHPLAARIVVLATVASVVLCATALAFCAIDTPFSIAEWLPGAGPMGLSTGDSGLYAALATTVGLFLVLLSAPAPSLAYAILLLALAGANGALLANHFLFRYIALEIVALCIFLAPLAERSTPPVDPSTRGGYLLLRLGDAGLLAAILILWHAAGTLHIDPALEAGRAMGPAHLGWAAAGLVLAVWVKLGCWPFHIWCQTGRRLSLAAHAWLYATVMPNLGAYLLYRVTPLLADVGPIQTAALWIGAVGALLATLLALVQLEPRAALVHVGAAQGGLMLLIAAAGCKPAVWLGLLALTPLRLQLFMASDVTQKANSTIPRRVAAVLLAFGGLTLLMFNLVTLWWTRESIPTTALFIAQAAAALGGMWIVSQPRTRSEDHARSKDRMRFRNHGYWPQWVTMGLLSFIVLVGGLAFKQIVHFTADVTHTTPPAIPTLQTLTSSLPALLAAAALTLVLQQLRRRSKSTPVSQSVEHQMWDAEKGFTRAAETLRSVIEVSTLERALDWIKRFVTDSARMVWIVEHGVLERMIDCSVQAVTRSASIAHRVIEQEGLEGILRRAVSGALALGRRLQRWHTGRLRRNLLWVPVALTLAIITLVIAGGNP